MKLTLATAALLLGAAAAHAQNVDCQTSGYCTNDLECFPDDERFTLRQNADGTATYGWVGQVQFTAKPQRNSGFTAWVSNTEGAVQLLTLSEDGRQATFSVVISIAGLYHSIQSLSCNPATS